MIEPINVLYGENDYLIQQKLNEKVKITEVDEINITQYDLLESTSDDVIEDLRTVSFFSERKVVIVKNIEELLKQDESVINDWIKYINNPNPDAYLFILMKELINENYPLGKAIFNNSFIEKINDLKKEDFPDFITEILKDNNFQITQKALKELIARTNYDLNLINEELEKLMLYHYEDQIINENTVNQLVSRNLEENIYELTNNLLIKNTNKTIEIYYDLLSKNEDPIKIMNNIFNKIKELIHTKQLLEQGSSQSDIEKHLNIKSGVAYYVIKNAKQSSTEMLETYLDRLSKLDFDIKSGKIDKKLGLEIFIIGA